mmetsp:Transcript_3887/g.9461  ORF Transcript_3887/g.9461 Transcript_3887/m.9461 type:complete len:228 (-) Transcript_3887:472-1155(-)
MTSSGDSSSTSIRSYHTSNSGVSIRSISLSATPEELPLEDPPPPSAGCAPTSDISDFFVTRIRWYCTGPLYLIFGYFTFPVSRNHLYFVDTAFTENSTTISFVSGELSHFSTTFGWTSTSTVMHCSFFLSKSSIGGPTETGMRMASSGSVCPSGTMDWMCGFSTISWVQMLRNSFSPAFAPRTNDVFNTKPGSGSTTVAPSWSIFPSWALFIESLRFLFKIVSYLFR